MDPKDFTGQSFDARDWAEAFVQHTIADQTFALDEGNMIAWFANALMRGYDHRQPEIDSLRSELSGLRDDTARLERYEAIFRWLLGEEGRFPESMPGRRYNFRTELRSRLEAARVDQGDSPQ